MFPNNLHCGKDKGWEKLFSVNASLIDLNHFYILTGAAGPRGMMGLKGDPGESISLPEVTVSPATQTVTENQTATFYCSASGNPRPVVTWRKVNGPLGEEALSTNDGKLEIPNSSYNDTGKYVCKAISALGQDQKMISLVVEGGKLFLFWSLIICNGVLNIKSD